MAPTPSPLACLTSILPDRHFGPFSPSATYAKTSLIGRLIVIDRCAEGISCLLVAPSGPRVWHAARRLMTTATPEADIRLDRVSKHFHEVVAVDDLSLDILRGEFFSMLGPSGCGKTTTLRMIAGFEDATAGAIYLGGSDVTNLPPFRRDVNTVFQNYALFPHLTVYDNVAFGPRRKHMSESEVKTSVGRMLEL